MYLMAGQRPTPHPHHSSQQLSGQAREGHHHIQNSLTGTLEVSRNNAGSAGPLRTTSVQVTHSSRLLEEQRRTLISNNNAPIMSGKSFTSLRAQVMVRGEVGPAHHPDHNLVNMYRGEHQSSKQQLTILSWPYALAMKCIKYQKDILQNCPIPGGKTCLHVCDPTLYNTSDIVIFNLCSHRYYPPFRPPNQKWVYVELEAPPQSKECWPKPMLLDTIYSSFNISSSFTEDADVPYFVNKRCRINRKWLKRNREAGVNYLAGKTRNIAWFNSHCETQSRREDYTKELQKYIDVDVYGKCGNLTCGSRKQMYAYCATELLNNKYRFFLSFENSLCQDYVTEKLGRVMDKMLNTIPITLGYANYSELLPKYTYIDVKDFASPKDLAMYLHELANNSSLYNEYIYRKNSLVCKNPAYYTCRLCRYAHEHQHHEDIIPDVRKFWSLENRCITPEQYLPNIFKQHEE